MPDTITMGDICLEVSRNCRIKRLSVIVQPFKGVRVNIPKHIDNNMALGFLRHREEWIRRSVKRMKLLEEKHSAVVCTVNKMSIFDSREKLKARIGELSFKYNLPFSRLFIRNQRTLWGSCSAQNNINLNIRLAWLPSELMDYVITHELVHTKIRNHKAEFWSAMDRLIPDSRSYRKQLAQYRYLNLG